MYQIRFDNYLLYDPRSDKHLIRDPDIHLAVGEAGSVSFTIDRDHPYIDRITKLKGVLSLLEDGNAIWRGRVIRDTRNFILSREIEAEGLLACLNDSVIPPFNFPEDFLRDSEYQAAVSNGNVVRFFLKWLLDQHNSQVSPAQQIILGEVTVSDPNNYISRSSSEYNTTMSIVRDKLVNLLGGHLLPDYSGETTVLNYYADLPLTNTQTVEYGGNLLDLMTETDATETYTAILPIGAEGLTLEDIADGDLGSGLAKKGRIIYSTDAEAQLGGIRIVRTVEWSDVAEVTNLQRKAITELTGHGVMQAQSITVKAVDLGVAASDTYSDISAVAGKAIAGLAVVGSSETNNMGAATKFRVGRYVRLNSTPHGFSATLPLMELEPDIFDPGNTNITMGISIKTASDIANSNQSVTQEKLDQQQMELNKHNSNIDEIAESTRIQVTEALQSCESIIFSALDGYVESSRLEEYKQTISSQFAILANEISISLSTVTEHIENVNGDLQSKYEKITKSIRFTDEGIIIGESGSEVLLRLDHDIIQILRANVPELFIDERGVNADSVRVRFLGVDGYIMARNTRGRFALRKGV